MSEDPKDIVENAIGELYRGFYRLRQSQQYQEEYDSMGALMNMLMKDREYMRQKYLVRE
jgi:hypothetical protein